MVTVGIKTGLLQIFESLFLPAPTPSIILLVEYWIVEVLTGQNLRRLHVLTAYLWMFAQRSRGHTGVLALPLPVEIDLYLPSPTALRSRTCTS